jgi:hypothetical protein
MIVTVTFDVDTDNKYIAFSTVNRIFSTLCLPETVKTMVVSYPQDEKKVGETEKNS